MNYYDWCIIKVILVVDLSENEIDPITIDHVASCDKN
jgi:hypothetical protein